MRDCLTGRRKASFPTSELLLEKALSNIILQVGILVFVAQRFWQGGADVLHHRRKQFKTLLRGSLRTFQQCHRSMIIRRHFSVHTMLPRLLLLMSLVLPDAVMAEDDALEKLFARYGVQGTIVIASQREGVRYIHHDVRAEMPFPTASTFKILNTLIAVQEKVIAGKDSVLEWDGQHREIEDWNRDQTLQSAFKVSCVWCYQAMARRVGAEKYRDYLRATGYGILREPFDATTFWLDGSLQISAVGQVEFLERLHAGTLPFSQQAFDTLREIMLAEKTPSYALWTKTGWAARSTPQVGWYVGYVETLDDVWYFALNIDITDEQALPLRAKLTREALVEKGILPAFH